MRPPQTIRGLLGIMTAGAFLLGSPAAAYYHFVHFQSASGPYIEIPEKFDLNALQGRPVNVFLTDASQATYAGSDSFGSVLGALRQAAAAWNAVDASALRMSFAGTAPANNGNTPDIEISFQDTPGVLALTGRTTSTTPVQGPGGQFFPVLKSVMLLSRDVGKHPSYTDDFLTTTVHEMGHAVGLQHTFTASAMTQAVTRNTSRAQLIAPDDIAGVALLYPSSTFSGYGSITGRVTLNGQGVNLASVVALRPTAPAISAMTNPDGTYRIDGLPPDTYYVYVHPIAPDAIAAPVDLTGQGIPMSPPFDTQFYPGTRNPAQFSAITVNRSATVTGIDFSVARRNNIPVYDLSAYTYVAGGWSTSTVLNAANSPGTLFVTMASGNIPAPQQVQTIGGVNDVNFRPYSVPQWLSGLLVYPTWFSTAPGPRHLLFLYANDMYVLPSAFTLAQKQPPSISSLTPIGDGSVIITGSNMSADTRIFFDSVPATIRVPFTGSDAQGAITVVPPPGTSGQRSVVAAYNSDGQNSLTVQGQNPPLYAYDSTDAPQISITPPNALPAGATTLVDITGVNTKFADGQTTAGFGSSDISVRRVWVLSPTHLVADVTVAPNASLSVSPAVVISGMQGATLQGAIQVQPANPRIPALSYPVTNAAANQQSLYPGATASVSGTNLALGPNGSVTLNGNAVPVVSSTPAQINFLIPPGTPVGMAILIVNNGTDTSLPLAIQIDAPPPSITAATTLGNTPITTAQGGNMVNLLVAGLDASVVGTSRVHVSVGGIDVPVVQVVPAQGQPPLMAVTVILPTISGAQVPVTLSLDGNTSAAFYLTIR